MENESAIRRHKRVYALAHKFAPGIALKKYNFQKNGEVPDEEYPFLILANHATESDMIMVGSVCKKFPYFVCSEHLVRGKYGKLIVKYFDPITEKKGAPASATVREIIRRLKAGFNIILFPEGSRSFNGITLPLEPSIGKLIKTAGCGLATVKLKGGYFIAPRWAYTFRKGPASATVVRTLSPEELKTMTPQEITELINTDLYEDAYATQRELMADYTGERLAEGLENYLFICPKCGAYDAMQSRDDEFWCPECGLKGKYTVKGFLEGEDLPYDSVADWGAWTDKRFLEDMKNKQPGELLFDEQNTVLYEVTNNHERIDLYSGNTLVYADRLICGETEFRFDEIPTMSMLNYGKTLLFVCDGKYYGLTGDRFHARKEDMLFKLFKEKK